jgi:acyl carrier protein
VSYLKAQMIEFVVSEIIRRPGTQIDEKTSLVSSGLIDSLALVDILQKLEDLTNTRLPVGKIQAKDMDTIERMFLTAQQVGKPKKERIT